MIVSHLLLILHKKIQFYIFMFEAWNVAKGHKSSKGPNTFARHCISLLWGLKIFNKTIWGRPVINIHFRGSWIRSAQVLFHTFWLQTYVLGRLEYAIETGFYFRIQNKQMTVIKWSHLSLDSGQTLSSVHTLSGGYLLATNSHMKNSRSTWQKHLWSLPAILVMPYG